MHAIYVICLYEVDLINFIICYIAYSSIEVGTILAKSPDDICDLLQNYQDSLGMGTLHSHCVRIFGVYWTFRHWELRS